MNLLPVYLFSGDYAKSGLTSVSLPGHRLFPVWQTRRCWQFWLLVYLHPTVTLLVRHSIQMLRADVKVWIKPGSSNKSMHDVSKQWDDTHNGGCNSDARYTTIMAQHYPSNYPPFQIIRLFIFSRLIAFAKYIEILSLDT